MKHLAILCIFCLACQTVLGQLKGKYVFDCKGLGVTAIDFLEDNKFRYAYDGCPTFGLAEGTYAWGKNELILKFEKHSIKSTYTVTNSPAKNQSAKIHLTVVGERTGQSTLSFSQISIQDKNGKSIWSGDTLKQEFVEIDLPISAEKLYLKIESRNFESISYAFVPNQNHQINAILGYAPTKAAVGKLMVFDIKIYDGYILLIEKGKEMVMRFEEWKG